MTRSPGQQEKGSLITHYPKMKLAGGRWQLLCKPSAQLQIVLLAVLISSGCPSIKSTSLDVTHVISCVRPTFHYVPLSHATNKEAGMA